MEKADKTIEVKGDVTGENSILAWDACHVEGGRPFVDPNRIKSLNLRVEAGKVAVMGVECHVDRKATDPLGTATTRWVYFPVQHLHIQGKNVCSERHDLGCDIEYKGA